MGTVIEFKVESNVISNIYKVQFCEVRSRCRWESYQLQKLTYIVLTANVYIKYIVYREPLSVCVTIF